ncbi:MAG: aldo/keto reductase [Alphaproteobacteria bacterium]
MKKALLGDTGLEISPLGLGTVKFGRNQGVKYPHGFEIPDETALADLLALAKELGINMLDTAPAYGSSEERLGRLLTGQRGDWVIVGKAGEEFEEGESFYNFTPEHFEMSLERSLKRLNTDYIDVLMVHSDGHDVENLSDALIAKMQDFKTRGMVRAIGASTKTAEGGIRALEHMDAVMAMYTADYRDEEPVLDYAAAHNKGVILKKALNSGHFSSLHPPRIPSGAQELGPSGNETQDPRLRGEYRVGEAFEFAFSHPGVTAAIVGTINPAHLRENVGALKP